MSTIPGRAGGPLTTLVAEISEELCCGQTSLGKGTGIAGRLSDMANSLMVVTADTPALEKRTHGSTPPGGGSAQCKSRLSTVVGKTISGGDAGT